MKENLPFSQSSENNKHPILEVLRDTLGQDTGCQVLEIGTGTGQHAIYFAGNLPRVQWQPSDQPDNLWLCQRRCQLAALPNLLEPVALDVSEPGWPDTAANHVYSANTAHIMGWPEVEAMFRGVAALLQSGGVFYLYGPFNYDGRHTSEGNRRFDVHLRSQDSRMGLRDMGDLRLVAAGNGLILATDHDMPANNRLLEWHKT